MDAIAETAFQNVPGFLGNVIEESPTLLTVIIDTNPIEWLKYQFLTEEEEEKITLKEVTESVLVMVNAHLSLNNGNKVCVIASHATGSKFLFPKERSAPEQPAGSETDDHLLSDTMYRQFRVVDESVLRELESLLQAEQQEVREKSSQLPGDENENEKLLKYLATFNGRKSTLAGSLGLALTYSRRVCSAGEETLTQMTGRVLIVSVGTDDNLHYVPLMNGIFAAQKMRMPLDVCKIGEDAMFLRQASDATNGVYMNIKHPKGLMQYLATGLFVEPNVRQYFLLPTQSNIDFRASCFVTKKTVEIGYVCSVCLCILSFVPSSGKCPTCSSPFNSEILAKLRRKPVVAVRKRTKKRRKLNDASSTPQA